MLPYDNMVQTRLDRTGRRVLNGDMNDPYGDMVRAESALADEFREAFSKPKMKAGLITGGIPTKRVPVFGITTETDEVILSFATNATGETWGFNADGEFIGSIFGREIRSRVPDEGYALVVLYTDQELK